MGKTALGCFVLVGILSAGICAQDPGFEFNTSLESGDFPDLDSAAIIEGDVGLEFEFTGNMVLTPSNVEGGKGAQGWSCGVSNEGVEIIATTFEGTASADKADGGLFDGGFRVQDMIDPAKNDGKAGMVQAIVLSFVNEVTLSETEPSVVGKNTYRATVGAEETIAVIAFEDGLVGKGQPVVNNVTSEGATIVPALGSREITIRAPLPETETICDDEIDNDQDGATDCDDSDCADDPACVVPETETICDDEIDNDQDGATDCDDSDCADDPACVVIPETETICDDEIDNDQDGATDCDDSDCAQDPACITGNGFNLVLSTSDSTREGSQNVAEIAAVSGTQVEVRGSIEPVGEIQEEGAQGWSVSVHHDKDVLTIQDGDGFPTIDGTDAGDLFDGGFKQTSVVDPANNDGKAGFVSAVVLSFVNPVWLDPSKDQTIVRSNYSVAEGAEKTDFPTDIVYLDGLVGAGQPVPNVLTVGGGTVQPKALIALELKAKGGVTPVKSDFVRGDPNDDGKVNIADPIWIINELVREGPETACQSAADANDDGLVDLSDAMYLIQWRFMGGEKPVAPWPDCGADPTADDLPCPQGSVGACP